jgi:hypothetical protein
MNEEASITFYSISRCGYYRRGQPKPPFGDIGSVLKTLSTWVKDDNRKLKDTCPFRIAESASDLGTYCFDIQHQVSSGDYLLTTWNEGAAFDGQVASVSGASKVGVAEVTFQEIPDGGIPGHATYFWILPTIKALATVRFNRPLNGHRQMNKFLQSYMARCAPFVKRRENDEGEVEIVGFANLNDPNIIDKLNPSFLSAPYRKKGQLAFLRERVSAIRKMIKTTAVIGADPIKDAWWQASLRAFGVGGSPAAPEDVRIKQEINYTPTAKELEDIIADWDKHAVAQECKTQWDDVGFVLTGEPTPRWLSHTFAKDTVELDVVRENDEVVQAGSLLNALDKKRSHLMSLLEE